MPYTFDDHGQPRLHPPYEQQSLLWQQVLEILHGTVEPVSLHAFRKALGHSVVQRSTIANVLRRMMHDRIVVRTSLGCYQLAPPQRTTRSRADDEPRLARWNRIIAAEVGP